MTPVIDVSAVSYVTAAIVAYYAFLYLLGRVPRMAPPAPCKWPLLAVVIPARNEERVIQRTVQEALACPYQGQLRVLIMDDASNDQTMAITDRLAGRDQRVLVCHRPPSVGGRGKSDVLNHAYRHLQAMVISGHEWLAGATEDEICMCIVDADGHLSPTAAIDAVMLLSDPRVGAVQIGVQIRNARDSLLARLQDIEFVGFSFMVQTARDRLGSVGLGGNGQFTRFTALADLGEQPWRSKALTEDLDLGVRLQLAGWRLRFCPTAWVAQEGLTRLRPLARQRTRWTQGHYQCWRYLSRILTARHLRVTQRLDSLAYLLLILLVVLVTAMAVIQLLAIGNVLRPDNAFLSWMGDGVGYRITIFALSWLPVFLLLETYQRFAQAPLARWELPAYCLFFAVYVYIWAIATARAWMRMALRRTSWTKTPRVADATGATGG